MSTQLTCDQLVAYQSDYIVGNLTEELTQAAQEHLATCANCRVVLDSTQKMILLYKERGQVQQIPAERKSALYDQLTKAFNKPQRS